MIYIDMRDYIQVEHLDHSVTQQFHVAEITRHHRGKPFNPIAKPQDGVVIKVVCRFVKQKGIRAREEYIEQVQPVDADHLTGCESLSQYAII